MTLHSFSFTDRTRPIKASRNFAGTPDRRIDALVWEPADADGRLIVYCHGTYGQADNAAYLAEPLAADGAIVVAPQFPLTSTASFTGIDGADITDVGEQVRDISFLIDMLLGDPDISPVIDPTRIATIGHSLGAITCWFASFGETTRDPRIAATVMLGAGDPIAAADHLGLGGIEEHMGETPALLISADEDLFAQTTGSLGIAYLRLDRPKYELIIRGGTHLWFLDGYDQADGNPDRAWFAEHAPNQPLPEHSARLIGADRQQAITIAATRAFLANTLDGDSEAFALLESLPVRFPESDLIYSV